jgi:hypothetical protein
MGGFVIDIWIAFLIRTIANAWRNLASAGWPVYPGKIAGFRYNRSGYGCDFGEYRYKYEVDGNSYLGIYKDPYFISRARDAQVSESVGADIEVRVSPKDPAKSVLINF